MAFRRATVDRQVARDEFIRAFKSATLSTRASSRASKAARLSGTAAAGGSAPHAWRELAARSFPQRSG